MAAADDPEAAVAALLAPLPPGRAVGVAVSGGSDSTALLLAARLWARGRGVALRAATCDHGLRPEAAAEARAVAARAAALGVPHATLPLRLRPGPAVQARARAARYDALGAWAAGGGVDVVLLGHTADDVAETLLMRLRRGVGVGGLARMREGWRDGRGIGWGRPLLALPREALRLWLRARGEGWIDDPSNDDPRHERARTRRALAALGWDAAPLARSAAALREADDALARRAAALEDELVLEGGDVAIPAPLVLRLRAEEPETLRRIVAGAVRWIGGRPPRGAALGDALAVPGRRTLAGCTVAPRGGALRIGREAAACPPPVPWGEPWDRWTLRGPAGPDLAVGALGSDVDRAPWRDGGLPRPSAMASPAVRRGAELVAAPLAGLPNGYDAAPTRPLSATLRPPPPLFR